MLNDIQLTPKAVGELLGFTSAYAMHYLELHRVPCRRTPGGHRRYRLTDVQRFVLEREQKERELI